MATVDREQVADILALAPPYRTLELRVLRQALEEAREKCLEDSDYGREIAEAIRVSEPEETERLRKAKLTKAREIAERERRKAGRAATDPDRVSAALTRATDVFAAEDWANLTLDEVRKAGNRIGRLAGQLRAFERFHEADQIVAELEGEARK